MPVITFNAFSFLQKKLRHRNIQYSNAAITVEDESCITDLIHQLQLETGDIGAALVNGRAASFDIVLKDNDRVALVPPVGPMSMIGIKSEKTVS